MTKTDCLMNLLCRICALACLFSLYCLSAYSQNDYADKISAWKTLFPKEEVIAASLKETISFGIKADAKPGEPRVKATIRTEAELVPIRDYIKYEDGLFYTDENTIANINLTDSKGKAGVFDKNCMAYSDDDIFHNDTRLCIVKFQFGEKGKSFRYSYSSDFRDVKYVTSFYLNDHIPAVQKIVEFLVPSWLELDLREFNFAGTEVEKTTVKEGDITKISFRLENALPYRRESNSPHPALSQPHIICVTKGFTENGVRTPLFGSVKDVYGWYSSLCESIGNKPAELKSKVDELVFGKKTDMEKIESIFYWVQDKIRYIAFENGIMGFKPDAAQNVYQKKYGDCKGKANLLKEMLKIAGYDARLTWIGTSDLPYDYSLPSLAVDNHMICTVILNGKKYFLDGTEENIAVNDYAQRIQGKQVLIEDGKNYILDRIPEFPAERNRVKNITKLSIDGDRMKGSTTVEFNGEAKVQLQRAYHSIRNDNKADALSNFLRNGNENVEMGAVRNPDFNERQKPMLVGFDFIVNNQVTKAGNELYVVMDWDKEFSSMEFDGERKSDYEFDHKYHVSSQVELEIPAGYKVDYLPEPVKKTTAQYSFEGSYANKGKSVIYTKTIIINKAILRKSDFNQWNSFIRDLSKFYNDQVVLAATK